MKLWNFNMAREVEVIFSKLPITNELPAGGELIVEVKSILL